jgi:hypothetical protein
MYRRLAPPHEEGPLPPVNFLLRTEMLNPWLILEAVRFLRVRSNSSGLSEPYGIRYDFAVLLELKIYPTVLEDYNSGS